MTQTLPRDSTYCQQWRNGKWKTISVIDALNQKDKPVRCHECHGAIVLMSEAHNGTTRAHAEHRPSFNGCRLSYRFDENPRKNPNPVLPPKKLESIDNNWDEAEIKAAVFAYLEMLGLEKQGEPFKKTSYYRKLAEKYNRTQKAFEYRMQNISYILSLMGKDWIEGLKPAKNVGTKVGEQIERFINMYEKVDRPLVVAFEIKANEAAKKQAKTPPKGNSTPEKNNSTVTQYKRDPEVKGWVLRNSKGQCENCDSPAPFLNVDNEPFLEVHHVKKLADKGSDTIENAIALCPNCHREFHYSKNKSELVQKIYKKVFRLKHE